jgi:hypothetical protein
MNVVLCSDMIFFFRGYYKYMKFWESEDRRPKTEEIQLPNPPATNHPVFTMNISFEFNF